MKFSGKLLLLFAFLVITGCDSQPMLTPLSKDAVILAFGDSLTHGTGASLEESYPARLQNLISRTVINAGIPGETTNFGLKRLPALLQQHRPALLILCHGGNDILRGNNLKQTKENLQQMINLATASNTQVVMIAVPKFGIFMAPAPFYEELADANHLPLEKDVLGDILGKNALKSDQIHPNSEGYKLFAERIRYLLQASGAL